MKQIERHEDLRENNFITFSRRKNDEGARTLSATVLGRHSIANVRRVFPTHYLVRHGGKTAGGGC